MLVKSGMRAGIRRCGLWPRRVVLKDVVTQVDAFRADRPVQPDDELGYLVFTFPTKATAVAAFV